MSLLRTLMLSLMLSAGLAFSAFAEPLDLNAASAAELAASLAGIGEKKAQAIVSYRDQNGGFQSVEQITEVSGIGPKLLEANRANLKVVSPTETPVETPTEAVPDTAAVTAQ